MRHAIAAVVVLSSHLTAQSPPPSVQHLSPLPAANGLELAVRLGESDVVLDLQPVSLRAPGFVLLVDRGGVLEPHAPPAPATFRGTIRGRDGSVAASITADGVTAMIDTGGATWGVQPQAGAHVVHRNDAVEHSTLQCGCAHAPQPAAAPMAIVTSPFVHEAQLAIDADFEFFQRNGSSVAATLAAIEAILNPVDEVYRRDLQIRYRLSTVIVRTAPLYTSPGVAARLTEFQNHWNANHAAIARDVAHLFSGVADPWYYGIANLPSACSVPNAYCVSCAYQPVFVDNVVLVAHELGHTWDGQHCLSWPCNIMCPLLPCAGTVSFGPLETPSMLAYRDAQTCLTVIAAGAFAPFGSGCTGSTGVPAIGAPAGPVLGQTFTVTLANARANAAAILAIGASDEAWLGIALPLSLAPLGAPGCTLLASPDVTIAAPTNTAGAASWSLQLPAIPELFGITLFTQWAVVDPNANQLGLALSNAGAATLGDQ